MDSKELKALLKICRQNGVHHLKTADIELDISPEYLQPQQLSASDSESTTESPYANFPDGELTPEQLAFYSSGGRPEEDPFRQDN